MTPKPMVNTPHRMYPNAMNGRRLPSLSLAVPMRNVQKVDTTAETPTIHATMDGSGAIFRYTKVLNQEFSMFQQICPAIPSTQMSAQFFARYLFHATAPLSADSAAASGPPPKIFFILPVLYHGAQRFERKNARILAIFLPPSYNNPIVE